MTGTGTQADPYIISSVADVNYIASETSAYYELSQDIDFSGASMEAPHDFSGSFDLKGYTISNIGGFVAATVARRTLFRGDTTGQVRNGVLDFNVSASTSNDVSVFDRADDGCVLENMKITGSLQNAGSGGVSGFARSMDVGATVQNVITTLALSGSDEIAGFYLSSTSGFWNFDVKHCIAINEVTDLSGSAEITGFQSSGWGIDTPSSFWNATVNSDATDPNVPGKTTAELQDIDTYTNLSTDGLDEAFDMVDISSHSGDISDGVWFIADGYPQLWFEYEPSEAVEITPDSILVAQLLDGSGIDIEYDIIASALQQGQGVSATVVSLMYDIIANGASQSQQIDSGSVSALYSLISGGLYNAQSIDSSLLSIEYEIISNALQQDQNIDQSGIDILYGLIASDIAQQQSVDATSIGNEVLLFPNSLEQASLLSDSNTTVLYDLSVSGSVQGQPLQSATLTAKYGLSASDIQQGQSVDGSALDELVTIIVNDLQQNQSTEDSGLQVFYSLAGSNVTQGQVIGIVNLIPYYIVTGYDLQQNHQLEQAVIGTIGEASRMSLSADEAYLINMSENEIYKIALNESKKYSIITNTQEVIKNG